VKRAKSLLFPWTEPQGVKRRAASTPLLNRSYSSLCVHGRRRSTGSRNWKALRSVVFLAPVQASVITDRQPQRNALAEERRGCPGRSECGIPGKHYVFRRPVKVFQAGARTNPLTGISAAPISNPTIPEPVAVTIHSTAPATGGSAWAATSAAW
jgi:hypothetical protein